jgi:hypothetical protein
MEDTTNMVTISYKCEECGCTLKKIEITEATWAKQCDAEYADSCDYSRKTIWRVACSKCEYGGDD